MYFLAVCYSSLKVANRRAVTGRYKMSLRQLCQKARKLLEAMGLYQKDIRANMIGLLNWPKMGQYEHWKRKKKGNLLKYT